MTASDGFDAKSFERLLELYGARLEHWPEHLRGPARDWMEGSEAAQQAWQRASRLDAMLDAAAPVEPSPALLARIAAIPITHGEVRRGLGWPFGASSFLGWGAAAMLGLWVGGVSAPMLEPLGSMDRGAPVAERELEAVSEDEKLAADEWSELSELSLGVELELEEE